MIKTESAAIELTATLWKIKAETDKEKWEILDELGFYLKQDCPCCDYVYHEIGIDAGYFFQKCDCNLACPMTSLWPRGCMYKKSPYKRQLGMLSEYIKPIRRYYSLKIAKFAGELAGTWWEP